MGFDFRFRTVEGTRDVRGLVDFLIKQNLDYPRYDEWVQRAEAELVSGWKTGILALSDGRIVGNLIYQKHKELSRVRELKNMRIHSDLRGRYFARFMLRQAELGLGIDFDLILCDVRESQREIIDFMTIAGYKKIGLVNLYEEHNREVVMAKAA